MYLRLPRIGSSFPVSNSPLRRTSLTSFCFLSSPGIRRRDSQGRNRLHSKARSHRSHEHHRSRGAGSLSWFGRRRAHHLDWNFWRNCERLVPPFSPFLAELLTNVVFLHQDYHPLGTASMLPRDKGGVVDTKLVVRPRFLSLLSRRSTELTTLTSCFVVSSSRSTEPPTFES